MRTIVIAGGTGFIGSAIRRSLEAEGDRVLVIGRRGPDARWGDRSALSQVLEGADALLNFAGKSINSRYTDANREALYRSRLDTTRELREAMLAAKRPPATWLNASTATIYRIAMDAPQTESAGQVGEGFTADLAREWEAELFAGELPGVRRIALRTSIALGAEGMATKLLVRLARLGLGGPQIDHAWFAHRRYRGIGPHPTGDGFAPWQDSRGRQLFSWIHIDDYVRAVRFLLDHDELSGPVNLASPFVSDNRTLMRELRRAVRMPIGIPSPRAVLEPAMWVLRNEPELVLQSRWSYPEVLLDAGFEFEQPHLRGALRQIVRG